MMTRPTPALLLACLSVALAACTPAPTDSQATPTTSGTTAPTTAPLTRVPEIPVAYLGEWNSDPADCGSSRNDSRLVIEPARISWWESSGPVTAVTVLGNHAIDVTSELTGEGETWSATYRFTLRDPDTLVATHAEGGALTRMRCPAAAQR